MIAWRIGSGTHRTLDGEVLYGDTEHCLVTLTPVAAGYLASVTERETTWCAHHAASAYRADEKQAKAWAEDAVARFERMLASVTQRSPVASIVPE